MKSSLLNTKTFLFVLLVLGSVALVALYFNANFRNAAGPSELLEPSTVYLVRHAEKTDASRDSTLSPTGLARAEKLRHALSQANVEAIYVSQYLRTQQTAAPLAEFLGLELIEYGAGDAVGLAARVRADNQAQNVVIVGHSNTLDDLAAAFGRDDLAELSENQYDRLYVLRLRSDGVSLEKLRYGAETP